MGYRTGCITTSDRSGIQGSCFIKNGEYVPGADATGSTASVSVAGVRIERNLGVQG